MRRPVEQVEEPQLAFEHPEFWGARPRTRGDCIGGMRPCPWISCKWHLSIDVETFAHGNTITFNVGRRTEGEKDRHGHYVTAQRRTKSMRPAEIRAGRTVDERATQLADWWAEGHATCALDLADEGGMSLESVGEALAITREGARVVLVAALAKAKLPAEAIGVGRGDDED